MEDRFKQLLKKNQEWRERSEFTSQLFPVLPWSEMSDLVPSIPTSMNGEKGQTLEALERFVKEKSEEEGREKLVFPGGELRLKKEEVSTFEIPQAIASFDQYRELLGACARCANNLKPIFELDDSTRPPIDLLLVGDYPREEGNRPFLLAQEQLLERMITAMKMEKVVKSLAVKCFSQVDDSAQLESWSANCRPILMSEIFFLRPKMVLALGAFATRILLGKREKLSSIHGKIYTQKILSQGVAFEYKVMPIFHPDLLLINPKMKATTWSDLQEVMRYFGKIT